MNGHQKCFPEQVFLRKEVEKILEQYQERSRLEINCKLKPSNFTKNKHLILSSRISDLFWSIEICPWQFFTEVRIIFGIYFQLNLFLRGSLIFVKNYVYSAFSNKFYIAVSCSPKKDNLGRCLLQRVLF